jgi:hypothetical protein
MKLLLYPLSFSGINRLGTKADAAFMRPTEW